VCRRIGKDGVDHASNGAMDGNLRRPGPPRRQLRKERLEHRRLEAVADPRARRREETGAHVCAERGSDSRQHGSARVATAVLDQPEVCRVDARDLGDDLLR
jgi:hypothetical protein